MHEIKNEAFVSRALEHVECCGLTPKQVQFLQMGKDIQPPFCFVWKEWCSVKYLAWNYSGVVTRLDTVWNKIREHWGERGEFAKVLEQRYRWKIEREEEAFENSMKRLAELREQLLAEPPTIFEEFCYGPPKAQATVTRRV
jgi:hypothetical protein